METSTSRLAFGLSEALPEGAVCAWGARFIVTQDGQVDLPPDRQDILAPDPEAKQAFLDDLNGSMSLTQLFQHIEAMLVNGEIDTRREGQVVLHFGDIIVIGDTKASAGYLYVVAFRTPLAEV